MSNEKPGFYPTNDVKERARGNWVAILATLVPDLEEALKKAPKAVPCPMPGHGTKSKKFRFYKDLTLTGGAVCTCGAWKEGFNVLMDYHGWTFEEARDRVAEVLGMERVVPARDRRLARSNSRSLSSRDPGVAPAPPVGDVRPPSVPAQAAPSGTCPTSSLDAATPQDQKRQESTATAGQQPSERIESVRANLAWLADAERRSQEALKRHEKMQEGLKEKILAMWNQAVSLRADLASPALAYLKRRRLHIRGLDLDDVIRFHPSIAYYDEEGRHVGDFPCILAAIVNASGQLVTLHRIYITKSGNKARVPAGESNKKMMPVPDDMDVVGAAIRLGNPESGIIGAAEGIETALAAYVGTRLPCWAMVSASIMEGFILPTDVEVRGVIGWLDKDRSRRGEEAGEVLAHRMNEAGIRYHSELPRLPIPRGSKGIDWNDVIISQGYFGFPRTRDLVAKFQVAEHVGVSRRAV